MIRAATHQQRLGDGWRLDPAEAGTALRRQQPHLRRLPARYGNRRRSSSVDDIDFRAGAVEIDLAGLPCHASHARTRAGSGNSAFQPGPPGRPGSWPPGAGRAMVGADGQPLLRRGELAVELGKSGPGCGQGVESGHKPEWEGRRRDGRPVQGCAEPCRTRMDRISHVAEASRSSRARPASTRQVCDGPLRTEPTSIRRSRRRWLVTGPGALFEGIDDDTVGRDPRSRAASTGKPHRRRARRVLEASRPTSANTPQPRFDGHASGTASRDSSPQRANQLKCRRPRRDASGEPPSSHDVGRSVCPGSVGTSRTDHQTRAENALRMHV